VKHAPWLDVAVRELVAGVVEVPGPAHAARILEYHQATGLKASQDEVPWCAAFANWCLRQAWVKGTDSALARSFMGWGKSGDLAPGAIVVLWRGTPTAATGHVGFLLDRTDQELFLLGGNQDNRVSVASFPTTRLLGARWPA
jgi:uncharacterized protein (TIGR02594 family)